MQILLIIALLFAILVAIFASQNTTTVPVTFLAWRVEAVSVSVLILVSAAVGALLTLLFGVGRLVRSGVAGRRRQKEIGQLQARIQELQISLDQRDSEIRGLRESASTPTVPLTSSLPDDDAASRWSPPADLSHRVGDET